MPEQQIIVTGASKGIGAAIVSDLDRRGFIVAGLSRSGEVPAGYGLACDVSDPHSIAAAVDAVAARGYISGVVNCAGAHASGPSADLPVEGFESTMRLNATSVLAVCQQVYRHLVRAETSLIVNIGSFYDKLAVAENVAYCASKAAVGAITRCLAAEWAKDGVRVINIAPGYIETDLNREFLSKDKIRTWIGKRVPVGRTGKPDEVARLVGALFAENIGFLSGETIYLDGVQGINL
ncbi:SDR family oxidoreductase [Mesorhizobium sp. M2A.F.Ca.ET.039.01.1.1]|uniref:SDR family NAD(P)-dependent oxidoreductase n=1 Tax=Mesorhizobium sp. M2A.F.Ca.ET.039.01.1.1 TaxID=2496746 RepID=UPI000FC9B514|nr:SDR family oxidoreductase [Mesorhizobium sp. M2A.F.Ca.ET.039.01.1.1]RWX72322.1 SDR family oxidoreductase [Mesorhizobium sp. M2A.F.Ca.ET.039.01.1.1]